MGLSALLRECAILNEVEVTSRVDILFESNTVLFSLS